MGEIDDLLAELKAEYEEDAIVPQPLREQEKISGANQSECSIIDSLLEEVKEEINQPLPHAFTPPAISQPVVNELQQADEQQKQYLTVQYQQRKQQSMREKARQWLLIFHV